MWSLWFLAAISSSALGSDAGSRIANHHSGNKPTESIICLSSSDSFSLSFKLVAEPVFVLSVITISGAFGEFGFSRGHEEREKKSTPWEYAEFPSAARIDVGMGSRRRNAGIDRSLCGFPTCGLSSVLFQTSLKKKKSRV